MLSSKFYVLQYALLHNSHQTKRKLQISLCSAEASTFKRASLISVKIATMLNLNLVITLNILDSSIFGSEYKESLREGAVFPDDASDTARNFEISVFSLTTDLCGSRQCTYPASFSAPLY